MELDELLAAFVVAHPEFEGIPDATLAYYGEYTLLHVCAETWGDSFPFAFNLYLAHLLTVMNAKALIPAADPDPLDPDAIVLDECCPDSPQAGQVVASESVGDVSVSYDNTALNAAAAKYGKDEITLDLSQTQFGRMYLSMRRRLGLSFATTANLKELPPLRRFGYGRFGR